MPDPEALAHSERLSERIGAEIQAAGGRLPFDRYMELALYAPGLGYYTAGSRKFGAGGDFVTAPEITSLFGQCLAGQCRQVLAAMPGAEILEFGAGSGKLAQDLLAELQTLDSLPERYLILELSPDLRQRQQQTLQGLAPEVLERVGWLDTLPERFRGVMLANEVLDAMPVHRFHVGPAGPQEEYVVAVDRGLVSHYDAISSPGLEAGLARLQEDGILLPQGYVSEVNGRSVPWVRSIGESLREGVALLIDYGYPRAEYYHPQRDTGTLLCHYRHRAHPDPFWLPGLQDITAHVDFTAVAEAGLATGLKLGGYTTQAFFLFGCGLDGLVARSDPDDVMSHVNLMQAVKRLTLPGEMGESFKVMALTRNREEPLRAFALRDLRGRL